MPISVTTPKVASDLILVTDLSDSVRGSSGENDQSLTRLITRMSAIISRHLGYVIAEQTYQEDVPGWGDTLLQIMMNQTTEGLFPGGPITNVASVQLLDTEDGSSPVAITDYLIQDAMAGLLYRRRGWEWTAQHITNLVAHVAPNSERPLFRVTYTSGWTTPRAGQPSVTVEGTLPYDLRQACIRSIASSFYTQDRDPTLSRWRVGDTEMQYTQGGNASRGGVNTVTPLPDEVLGMLQDWVRVA